MSAVIVLILRLLLVICLYGFLILAVYTIWKEMRSTSLAVSERQIPTVHLAQIEGDAEEARDFSCANVTIGRDSGCEYPILNETVSAHHARLSYHHKQWWVEDLQSTNGTFLNDERIFTPTVIISGDELRCGQIILGISIRNKS
jgi:pSer/pThr/pTyr-binding forkhead associated (FHA) protein